MLLVCDGASIRFYVAIFPASLAVEFFLLTARHAT